MLKQKIKTTLKNIWTFNPPISYLWIVKSIIELIDDLTKCQIDAPQ